MIERERSSLIFVKGEEEQGEEELGAEAIYLNSRQFKLVISNLKVYLSSNPIGKSLF